MKMGKKNKEYFCSIILICCMFFPICYAVGNQKEIVQEILNFCTNNRHKYVAILDQGLSNMEALALFLNPIYDVRSQFVKKEKLEQRKSYHESESNLDTLIIQKNNNLKFSDVLKILNTRKIQKSILVVAENEVEEFKNSARDFAQNSYFYLLTTSSKSNFEWYTIMTFYNASQFIMNKITFDRTGKAIEDYNMNGYEIVATSLSWMPFIGHSNCDENGRHCTNRGLLVDLMNTFATSFNFTWDIYADIDNDWGLFPLDDGPYNASGIWKGVMGDVIMGKYQMSLNSWIWTLERQPILDFVPVTKDNPLLCLIPKPPEVDPGLFIRPFTDEVWQWIGILLGCGLIAFFGPYFFVPGWDDMKANSIIEVSLWFFFVLINAYYGGALTMFFVSEPTLPFNTLRDVLKAFPSWNFVFMDGLDNYFKMPADQGDADYIKFWSAVEAPGGREKHAMPNVRAGLEQLLDGQTVMHTLNSMLRGINNEDPKAVPAIKTFGAAKSSYFNMIFAENSPLVPLFNQAVINMFQNGQYERTDLKWKGAEIRGSGVVDLLILTPGQVFLIFAIFCFFLCTALFWLILEWCYNILNKNTTIDIEIWKKGKNFKYDNFDQKAMERIQWQTKEELTKEQLQAIHYDPNITIDNYNKVNDQKLYGHYKQRSSP